MKELKLKKCDHCQNIIRILEENKADILCCGSPMQDLIANASDASKEKHIPTFTRDEEGLEVSVSHVMEEAHYIEWIAFVTAKEEFCFSLAPSDEAVVHFSTKSSGKLYAYCNKHGLWETDVI